MHVETHEAWLTIAQKESDSYSAEKLLGLGGWLRCVWIRIISKREDSRFPILIGRSWIYKLSLILKFYLH